MREKQREEAKRRLQMLGVLKDVVDGFDNGILYYSERMSSMFNAVLYWMSNKPEIEAKIKEVEEEYGIYVYHVQHSHTTFGDIWSFMYVSKYEEEWEMDRTDLLDGFPIVYVWNETCRFGEFGSIQIRSSQGGIERIG